MIWRKRPNNIRFTDMAIYIDKTIYNENLSNEEIEQIFEYMYFIFKMLAYNNKWYYNAELYDDYAIYAATYMYFTYERNKKNNSKHIKSFLNYAKKCAYFIRILFDRLDHSQTIDNREYEDIPNDYLYTFSQDMKDSIKCFKLIEFRSSLDNVEKLIQDFLKKRLPYKFNSRMWHNIYISCLLTINKLLSTSLKPNKNYISYSNLLDEKVIVLFNLNSDYINYILLLTREILYIIANDLSEILVCDSLDEQQLNDYCQIQIINGDELL